MKKKALRNPCLYALLLLPALLFVALLFVTTKPTVTAQAQSLPYALSQMSKEDCVDFIVENGVEIPEGFADYPGYERFIQSIVQAVEANPDFLFAFNSYKTFALAENIRAVVNDYYETSRSAIPDSNPHSSILTQNEFYEWANGYDQFNCYAYAIEKTENIPPKIPGVFFAWQPGDFDTTAGSWDYYMDILDLVPIVKKDLEYLGYNVSVSDQFTNPRPNEKLIVVRSAWWDYHFMKYNPSDEYWYHKPGDTSVLKLFSQQLSNNDGWINEGVYGNGSEFHNPSYEYDSAIYYITYSKPFDFTVISDTNVSIKVKQGASLAGSIEIPSTTVINGTTYTVTQIAANGFAGQDSITNVTIPNTVNTIGAYAFANCTNLGSGGYAMYLPSSVTNIGSNAFSGCSGLMSIAIPAVVTTIGDYAFYDCSNLTIYAKAASKPIGWSSTWNPSNRPVMWRSGYVGNTITRTFDLSDNRYVEDSVYLLPGQAVEYSVENTRFYDFYVAMYCIQTFGLKDTYIELYSASGILLASDDNSGYMQNALIAYYKDYITSFPFKIRVKLKSANDSGTIKTMIFDNILDTVPYNYNINGPFSYSDYYYWELTGLLSVTSFVSRTYNINSYFLYKYKESYNMNLIIIDPSQTEPSINYYSDGPINTSLFMTADQPYYFLAFDNFANDYNMIDWYLNLY